jgi:aromatic-L-amino-acid decarboxylase
MADRPTTSRGSQWPGTRRHRSTRTRWAGSPLTVYVSREGHASIDKSMALLGMGRGQLRRIAVLDDFTMDLEALAQQVTADRANGYHPICVVGNAGTVNTGAVDPLAALAEFCRTQGLWFHVDDPQLARVGASDSRRLGLKQLSARVRTVHSSRGASAR